MSVQPGPAAVQIEMEADGDHYSPVQIPDLASAAHSSGLFLNYTSNTALIKEEPQEPSIKQEEEQLPDYATACVSSSPHFV